MLPMFKLTLRELFLLVALAGPCAGGQAEQPKEPGLVLSSRIATDGDFLTLPVKVDGEWRTFMVDTGTPTTLLDTSLVTRLKKAGETMRSRVPRHEAIPDLYVPPKMIVTGTMTGEIEFPAECAVISDDLSKARGASEQPIVGVLGMDFLERYAMDLDLVGGTLRLLDSRLLLPTKHDATLEIDMVHRHPCLQVSSRSSEFWALLDTGALLSFDIERKVYDRLVEHGELRPFPFEEELDGRKHTRFAVEGKLRELNVGPFTHYLLTVNDDDLISLLGLYYWRRYRCIFDFPRKQVHLDKGTLFDVSDDSYHAGIYVECPPGNDKEKVVTHIIKGCWADKYGVRVGDRLTQIDGKGVECKSIQTLYRRMSFHHDRPCELRLMRDGKEFTIALPATGLQRKPADD